MCVECGKSPIFSNHHSSHYQSAIEIADVLFYSPHMATRTDCYLWIRKYVIHILGVSLGTMHKVIHTMGITLCTRWGQRLLRQFAICVILYFVIRDSFFEMMLIEHFLTAILETDLSYFVSKFLSNIEKSPHWNIQRGDCKRSGSAPSFSRNRRRGRRACHGSRRSHDQSS